VLVYDRAKDKVWIFPRPSGWDIDESTLDKDGRLALVEGAMWNQGFKLWDFRNGTYETFDMVATENAGGHKDLGHAHMVNNDGWLSGLSVRDFSQPYGDGIRNILQYKRPNGSLNWTIAEHASMRTDEERYVVGSTYGGDHTGSAFENEIYLAFMD